jgi:DNAP
MELSDVEKMLTTFIPPFEQAHVDKHGNARLLGYFNLAGTVSGRLSSSNINLQQIPATSSRFAKPIKRCFKSTAEWIFVGLDYSSLELGELHSNM